MDEYLLFRYQDAKSRLFFIPGKIIAAVILDVLIHGGYDSVLTELKSDPSSVLLIFAVLYGVVSFFWFFVKFTGNWLVGFAAALGCLLFVVFKYDSDSKVSLYIFAASIFLGPLIDIINIIRCFILKARVTREGIRQRRLTRQEMRAYRRGGAAAAQTEQPQPVRNAVMDAVPTGQLPIPELFSDCPSSDQLNMRFMELQRIYGGNPPMMKRINDEYDVRRSRLS